MPKRPTKPGFPAVEDNESSGRHRVCGVGRAAIARTEQLAQRLEDHIEDSSDRFDGLTRDVESISQKFEMVNEHTADLRVDVAKVSTKLDSISSTLTEQNEIKHVRVIAEVETGKAATIAAIEDQNDRKKTRRALLLKVALVLVAAGGTVLGALIEHFR